ncbi:hypothetical protein K488DRAFT_81891 [Vararia minispora EC-137]|uniref:Uncharacterized protein n=1 Tax=Vararia minispora EC-137 TaxID=1314806 RepID=A0ACB8QXS5_9AGAM|nr:hypothetical protein K488DRAFT_81891 [Vararia minispora EC-137]
MPAPLPIYPSFSLVITQAYLTVTPPRKTGLVLPSRYHPYQRPVCNLDDDLLMTTVDYRFSPPPRLPPPPSVSFHPTHQPPSLNAALVGDDEDEDMEDDGAESDEASDESHFIAVYNLETAVRGRQQDDLRRRPSLTTIVLDLALLLKQKYQSLRPSGSGNRK